MEHTSNGHGPAPERPKAHLVGVHSFRGGAGKSTLAANLAFLVARAGARVAVLDADLQAPELHLVLGVAPKRILHTVSEFVQGQCEIGEVPMDLTLELGLEGQGTLHFLPASADLQAIAAILFDGYDAGRLNEHLLRLAKELEVDYLIVDTHLGINRESLLSLAISDTVLVLLRPDCQDRQGASVLVQMAKKVGVPSCWLVPNMIPDSLDSEELGAELEQELGAPVAALLPWCEELPKQGCEGLFAARQQDHPFTAELERIVERLVPLEVPARKAR